MTRTNRARRAPSARTEELAASTPTTLPRRRVVNYVMLGLT